MWQQLYYAITQCNAFIYYSDPYKENIKHYDLLLGEVYGLRALAHMTLFELTDRSSTRQQTCRSLPSPTARSTTT